MTECVGKRHGEEERVVNSKQCPHWSLSFIRHGGKNNNNDCNPYDQ